MFRPDTSIDLPTGCDLLAELGVDRRTLREISEDERAIRCPDRGAPYHAYGFASLSPEPPPDSGLHEAAEPWGPASSLSPAD